MHHHDRLEKFFIEEKTECIHTIFKSIQRLKNALWLLMEDDGNFSSSSSQLE